MLRKILGLRTVLKFKVLQLISFRSGNMTNIMGFTKLQDIVYRVHNSNTKHSHADFILSILDR